MFDTMGFFIPISGDLYNELAAKSLLTQRIDQNQCDENGELEIVFSYHNFATRIPSSDYRVHWKIDNTHFVYDERIKKTVLTHGVPYIRLEFSAPKVKWGHNLYSLDQDGLIESCFMVRESFMQQYGVAIPSVKDWFCYRADICANYFLENQDQVHKYINYCKKFLYPRRELKQRLDATGITFGSRYSTFKMYGKGAEFKVNDFRRIVNDMERRRLLHYAEPILRVEVELKGWFDYQYEKLSALYAQEQMLYRSGTEARFKLEWRAQRRFFKGCMDLYGILKEVNIMDAYKDHLKKFHGNMEMTKVMRSEDVFTLLLSNYGSQRARNYFVVFMLLVTYGSEVAKSRIPKASYYKAVSAFRSLGISVAASDIEKKDVSDDMLQQFNFNQSLIDRGFPSDFSLEISAENKYYQMPKAA